MFCGSMASAASSRASGRRQRSSTSASRKPPRCSSGIVKCGAARVIAIQSRGHDGSSTRLATIITIAPNAAAPSVRALGSAASSASPMFGLADTTHASAGMQSTAVMSGDHCAATTATMKAQLANSGRRTHDSRVRPYASSAADPATNTQRATATGSSASGDISMSAVAG